MADLPSVAWLNGRLVPWSQACLSIEDRGLQFAESLYEVLPITAGRVRLLADHVERMRRSAAPLDLERGVPGLESWQELAQRLIETERLEEGLLYAQLTGGTLPRDHLPAERPRPNFFAYLRALRFPRQAEAERGIRAITLPDARWENCYLKTTMLLPAVLARREAAQRGCDEALLLSPEGTVREGTSSNVFVVEGTRISTPRSTRHVLPGVTRPLVVSLAGAAGHEVVEERIPAARMLEADELFVTSTSRLVMPVVELDGRPIGDGRGGPVALDLAARLRQHFQLD